MTLLEKELIPRTSIKDRGSKRIVNVMLSLINLSIGKREYFSYYYIRFGTSLVIVDEVTKHLPFG